MARAMTRDGFDGIQAEIDHLWRVARPPVVQEVQEAAALGDRSENAAYIYGKKRLRQIDGRIRFLRRKIDGVVVVDLREQVPGDKVRFGAVVVVEDEDGVRSTFRLVDKEESDAKIGRISVQSPVGLALMGKQVGDVVTVKRPKGSVELEVIELRWGPGEP